MPNYDEENNPLTSSKKLSGVRLRRSGISSKHKSELKAAISGPYTFDGGGVSTAPLGDAPLRTLNGTGSPHSDSAFTVLSGPSPPPQTHTHVRRNSDIFLRRYHSSLAWPSNHPAITLIHGSPHHPTRAASRRSTQINRGSRWSRKIATSIFKGDPDEVTSQGLLSSDRQTRDLNLLDVPSDEFDPRTMIESLPALDLGLTSAASFGSVKKRSRKIDRTLRTSRTMLLSAPEKAKPDLVYTDDSDTFSSPPSTPSTPVWGITPISSISKTDPILFNKLELADVHAQIQVMIDSANRPFSTESGDHFGQDREPSNTQRNDIPLSLRPRNPVHTSFPQLGTAHRRSASSPPFGSGTYHAYPPDFWDRPLFRPITPVVLHKPAPPASPPPKTTPAIPASKSPADLTTPSTPTKKPSSERSDSPSVYSQPSPSSQICDVTPTSSNASSPDHPYAKNKHERLLAAISEGISSPTKPGLIAPSILRSGRGRTGNLNFGNSNSPLDTGDQAVPVIVVTEPNDDDLVYSESSFSIVDMYAGSAESPEARLRRRRTRTANSYQPRNALDSPTLRNSVSFNSPQLTQVTRERSLSSREPLKKRGSIFRPGLPSSFLSMSTLHEVEAAEATNTPRERKSFYAAVGLKGLFRRSSSKGSLFGQAQSQANGAADAMGGGSTSLTAPNPEAVDETSKGGWALFKWKR